MPKKIKKKTGFRHPPLYQSPNFLQLQPQTPWTVITDEAAKSGGQVTSDRGQVTGDTWDIFWIVGIVAPIPINLKRKEEEIKLLDTLYVTSIRGLARYSVYLTATVLKKLLHHFFIWWTLNLGPKTPQRTPFSNSVDC